MTSGYEFEWKDQFDEEKEDMREKIKSDFENLLKRIEINRDRFYKIKYRKTKTCSYIKASAEEEMVLLTTFREKLINAMKTTYHRI